MLGNPVSAARRSWWAAVAVLAVLVAGLPSVAHAVVAGTISGTVVVPAGVDTDDLRIHLYRNDAGTWRFSTHPVETDGSFIITERDTTLDYRLRLVSYDQGFVGGFYAGPGKGLARSIDGGSTLRAPQAGIQLSLLKGLELTVSYTLPPGLAWRSVWDTRDRLVGFEIEEFAPDGTGVESQSRWVEVGPDGDGTVTFSGLRADAAYRIYASDTELSYTPRFPKGYYRAGVDALIENSEHATFLRVGQTAHLKIGWTLVNPKPNIVTAPAISGTAVAGSTVTASAGTWAPSDVELAYAWLRDGSVIPGATGSTFAVTAADVGSSLSVRVTASRLGFDARATTSASVPVAGLAAPQATKKPKVKGTSRLGATVRASAPTWNLSNVKTTYQWLRGGTPIKGATSAKYRLKKADVGKRISVRATGARAGHEAGVVASKARKVAKGKPKMTAKAKAVKAGKRAAVVVRVRAAGLAKPTGTVTVKYGKKTVKVKLAAKRKGKVTVQLPRLRAGSYGVKVTFKPDAKSKKYVTKASAKKTTLRVA